MSKRSEADCLQDMLEAAERVISYCKGITYQQFIDDTKTQDAVVRNIEILGEAVKSIPKTTRRKHSAIPWKSIAGMRDRLIHDYFGVNYDVVWDVARNDLPQLLIALKKIPLSG